MHVSDALHHPVPVAHQLRGHPQGHDGNPEPVREGVIHRRLVFPVRAELRPIVGDGHTVIHQPALRLDVQRHCRHRLGDGEHRKECVSIDLPPSGYIGEATPDIDDLFAIHIGHYLQADLAAFADGGVKGFLDHAIWVRCHSTPSRSFLEPPICPSLHNLSPQETPSLRLSLLHLRQRLLRLRSRPALSTAVAMSRAMAMTALINKLTSRPLVFFGMFYPKPTRAAPSTANALRNAVVSGCGARALNSPIRQRVICFWTIPTA